MHFTTLFGAAALAATTLAQSASPTLVYQFENEFSGLGYVNIENIAVRTSNGQLLLNTVTGAIMAQLNPNSPNPQPELIVNITNALGGGQPGSLTGIAETSPDVFTVAAGNFQYGPQVVGGVAGVPGTFSVWNIDLTGPVAVVDHVCAIPEAGLLNGITTIAGNKDVVLIADSVLGAVWAVNVKTGEHHIAIQSDLWLPADYFQIGINGIKADGPYLYFTNSAYAIFGAVPIDNVTGAAVGEVTPFISAPNGSSFDDFSFKPSTGAAYLASGPDNAVYEASVDGALNLLVGGGDASPLLGPTATAFGPDGCTLYITTGGLGGGPTGPESGQVFSVDTCSAAKKAKKWIA